MKNLAKILEGGSNWLEKKQTQRLELSAYEVKLIAAAYKIHPLMFDPLALPDVASSVLHVQQTSAMSKTAQLKDNETRQFVQKHLATHLINFRKRSGLGHKDLRDRLVRFHANPGEMPEGPYGTATYWSPSGRLQSAHDVAVVRLTLTKGQESDWHKHPGDELLFVLHGSIEVELKESGLVQPVSDHDYVHFYSEQTHGVRCISDCAEVLVVRFLQLENPGPRYELLDALMNGSKNDSWPVELKRQMREEVDRSLMPFDFASNPSNATDYPQVVVDRRGLARLLKRAGNKPFQKEKRTPLDLSKSSSPHKKFNPAFFDRLQKGLTPVELSDLKHLASVYQIHEFLLHDFLWPTLRPAIVVKAPTKHDSCDENWYQLPDDVINDKSVTYLGPRRRLADAGISVSLVKLGANAVTPNNHHPGHELLVPLSGSFEVSVGGQKSRVSYGEDFYAQYDSVIHHFVRNTAYEEAKMLVVRFYT